MAEYIEREALLERIDGIWDCADLVFEPNDYCCRVDDCGSCKWAETKNAIRKIIANFPAADVVPMDFHERCLQIEIQKRTALEKADVREVVYCKDCRHRDPEDHKCDCGGTERQGCPFKVADDYFCAYGER